MEIPELSLKAAINILYALYYFLRGAISFILEGTIFQGEPGKAALYGDAITILAALTLIYLILELFEAGKKVVRIFLVVGWALLIASVIAERFIP
ncbi:MAG: hypothetical protein QXI39_00815 [Candidatus Bathyarchaeia archaeon]